MAEAVRHRRGLLRRLGRAEARSGPMIADPAAPAGERPLSALVPGDREVVCRVDGGGAIRQRLLELGMTPGATVEVIRYAPLGDPLEVRVRGYHLSLRRREAEAIWVRRETRDLDGTDSPVAAPRGAGGQPEQR